MYSTCTSWTLCQPYISTYQVVIKRSFFSKFRWIHKVLIFLNWSCTRCILNVCLIVIYYWSMIILNSWTTKYNALKALLEIIKKLSQYFYITALSYQVPASEIAMLSRYLNTQISSGFSCFHTLKDLKKRKSLTTRMFCIICIFGFVVKFKNKLMFTFSLPVFSAKVINMTFKETMVE